MKYIIPLLLVFVGICGLNAQSNHTVSPDALTKKLVVILKDMPVKSSNSNLIAELRAVDKEQHLQITKIHTDLLMYINQVRTKYGENTPEVEAEINYQKSFYFKQLKKILNTHQYAYLYQIHSSKEKTLTDIVDVNMATKQEIEKAKERLQQLQRISFIEFDQL